MRHQWTDEDAQQWIDEHRPGAKFIKFIRNRVDGQTRTDAIVTCLECKQEYTTDWYNYQTKNSGLCPLCINKKNSKSKRIPDKELKRFVEENSKCKFVGAERRKTKNSSNLYLKLICGEDGCNKEFEITWNTFQKPTSCRMCPECTDKIRRVTKRAHHAAKNNALIKCPSIANVWDYNKNEYGPEHYSAGSTAHVWFVCDKESCRHEWKTSISSVMKSILNGNNGCKECMKKYKEYTKENFVEELHKLHPHINLTSEFVSIRDPASFSCEICDNEWTVRAGSLIGYGKKKPTGCAVCSGKRLGPPPKYVNSIWADPIYSKEWAKYFDEEFMKTHTIQSNDYVDIPCPDCGKNKHIKICNLHHRGFRCSCNSKTSYPNRFMYSVFNQLKIEYEPEYHRNWTDGKRYDICNEEFSLIVENHGPQHYEDGFYKNRNLEEEQKNDAYKYELAKDNGFKNYVVLDCRKSEIHWIKNSIMNSILPQLFGFTESDIDWDLADRDAVKNIVKEVCLEWEKEKSYDYSIVGDKFRISKNTVQDYLVIGAKHGWCSYDSNWQSKKVYCFQFDKTWNSINEASAETGVLNSDISACCHKKVGYAGLHPETGEELVWCLDSEKETYTPRVNKARRSVVCIETMKEYRSIADAAKDTNTSPGVIGSACKDITKTAGGYHWSYSEDLTDEKIAFAKSHKPPVKSHLIYCVNNNTVYTSATGIAKYTGDYDVIRYVKGLRPTAGKSRYDYKFLYDYAKDDGTVIPGAITLGLITEEDALTQLTQQND